MQCNRFQSLSQRYNSRLARVSGNVEFILQAPETAVKPAENGWQMWISLWNACDRGKSTVQAPKETAR